MRSRTWAGPLALALVSTLLVPALSGANPSDPELGWPAPDGCSWPKYGQDLGHTFHQDPDCADLELTTASTLAPKWFFRTPDSVTASPSVVDGVVYVGDWAGTFYALPEDGTGTVEPLWTFEIEDENRVSFGRIVSSAAVADVDGTRVVAFGGGSTLYVLDAANGSELASLCLDPRQDPPPPEEPIRCRGSSADIEIESSPAIVEVGDQTWIVVGHSVHNRGGIGRTGVVAMRLDSYPWTLEPVWKFDPETKRTYTADPALIGVEAARIAPEERRSEHVITDDPLTYEAGQGSGCAGVWSSPAVDIELGLVFFGTANCTTDTVAEGEIGGEGVWSVDLVTGGYRWHFLPRGNNDVDDDFGASANLLPNGLIGHGGKDGIYYAFERTPNPGADGEQQREWEQRVGQPGHVNRNFSIGGMIGTPAVGEVNGEPAIFATIAVGTPIDRFSGSEQPDFSLLEDPTRLLSLHAFSADDGRILWRDPVARPSYGAPTYANGILLVPSTFGFSLNVYNADTGTLLGVWPLGNAPSSAPAIVGDSVYLGISTRQSDGEYKLIAQGPLQPLEEPLETSSGPSPLTLWAGVWGFQLAN
jgi:outer membrane protein assembly factor BamB